ncbi:MAG: histidine kinase [Flavobacteriaceae bacterium]|nr:histidine kinase [Flavobacteriaceae bacterium]
MEQEGGVILIISTVIIILINVFIVVLFSVFQRRKNKLLEEQKVAKKKFESEIAESQIEIREETLRNISWELHDNIGQLLTLAKIQLQNATPENIGEVSETITKSLNELRSLSKLINPEAIKKIELKKAIQLEIDRFNRLNFIKSELKIVGEEQKINKKSSIIIFRILQEFFSNTIKHSKASTLDVELQYTEGELKITAQDNGIGFVKEEADHKGIGLQNIENRAKLIGAKVVFQSIPEQGTSLVINYYF